MENYAKILHNQKKQLKLQKKLEIKKRIQEQQDALDNRYKNFDPTKENWDLKNKSIHSLTSKYKLNLKQANKDLKKHGLRAYRSRKHNIQLGQHFEYGVTTSLRAFLKTNTIYILILLSIIGAILLLSILFSPQPYYQLNYRSTHRSNHIENANRFIDLYNQPHSEKDTQP